MAEAKSGDTVRVHYRGTLDDGREFDSSAGRDPFEFVIGSGQVIPGFEKAAVGMAAGDKKNIKIACDDAYGPRDPEQVQAVPRDQIPQEVDVTPGARLQAQTPEGNQLLLTVVDANDEHVTLDANHPLAGHDLNFELELVEIVD